MLTNKRAVVTGASRGIGRVVAYTLAQHGAEVFCVGRDRKALIETCSLIGASGFVRATYQVADCSDPKDVRGLDTAEDIDILVNNAGDGGPTKSIEEYTPDDWSSVIASCLTSTFLCCHFLTPRLRDGGSIINMSSTLGMKGMALRSGYCAAKAGQIGLTKALAIELAPRRIRVNAIAPGAVAGERIERVISALAAARGKPVEEMHRKYEQIAPMRTLIDPQVIANLVAFLTSDDAAHLSGQVFPVTAGEVVS